jgi:uncharacterized protein (TIGR03437 family)
VIRLFIASLLSVMLCLAQQTISVGNAAGVSGGLAPGSILSIRQLKPPQVIGPVDPSRVSVQVRPSGSAVSLDAPLLPSTLLSIWAQLPASTPLGAADVTLTVDGQASAPARIIVTRTNFGLFTQAGNGLGSAIAQNQDATVNKLTNPALPGQYVTLWGTGLGSATSDEVTIQLGGTAIAPVYAGPAPALTGVDQIDFRIPDNGTLDGCYVSVIVKTGDIASNEATIAKASQPGLCEHPFGLSAAEMATLDSGGTILFGAIHLESDVATLPSLSSGPARLELALAEFLPRDAFDIGLFAQPLIADEEYFGCRASSSGLIGVVRFGSDIDAGDALTLMGPGQSAALSRGVGIYQMVGSPFVEQLSDPPFFGPGSWRIDGPGGRMIGPFQAELVLPPVVHWMNRDSLSTINRGRDQDVTWDATGYSDTDVASVTLYSTPPVDSIVCRAPAATGKLTIPSSLLETLPLGAASLQLGIAPRPNRRTLFSLPLTDGSAAQAFFDYSFSETISSQLSQ